MGYKICALGAQVFLVYQKVKWSIVPQNEVRMAALVYIEHRHTLKIIEKYSLNFSQTYIFSSKFRRFMLEAITEWYHYSALYFRLPTIKVNI
jgi:hypothetical protein